MAFTVITGASSGIGELIAIGLARDGHDLALVGRNKDKLEQLANDLRREHSVAIHVITQDLTEVGAAEAVLEACQTIDIEVDQLVNDAGFGMIGEFADQELAKIQEMILLNVLTLTKLTHLLLPQLKKYHGRILNVSSTAAFQPVPSAACYSATKAYVLSFSEALGEELKESGVSVTTLAPGPTQTHFFRAAGTTIDSTRMIRSSPEQVAKAAVDGFKKRKSLIIPGWHNRILVFSVRLSPRFLVPRVSRFFMGH